MSVGDVRAMEKSTIAQLIRSCTAQPEYVDPEMQELLTPYLELECGKTGHMMHQCPDVETCTQCGNTGHSQKDCIMAFA